MPWFDSLRRHGRTRQVQHGDGSAMAQSTRQKPAYGPATVVCRHSQARRGTGGTTFRAQFARSTSDRRWRGRACRRQRCTEAASQIKRAAQQAEGGDTGRLRIGFSGSVTVRLLPLLVRAFGQRYPGVHLDLSEGTDLELLTQVETGELDLGMVRLPTTRPSELRFQQVEQDHFCLALPKGHLSPM